MKTEIKNGIISRKYDVADEPWLADATIVFRCGMNRIGYHFKDGIMTAMLWHHDTGSGTSSTGSEDDELELRFKGVRGIMKGIITPEDLKNTYSVLLAEVDKEWGLG